MDSIEFNCEALVETLIQNQQSSEAHIKKILEHCKIELEPWHDSNIATIGRSVCSKDLIRCLALLYSKTGRGVVNNNRLAPLAIFRVIKKCMKNFVDLDDNKTVKDLKDKLKKYYKLGNSEPQLNQKLIEKIAKYDTDWDSGSISHQAKVAIYHTILLYIYASEIRPSRVVL